MSFCITNNDDDQKLLQNIQQFEEEMKQKKKKLDQKTKIQKALRGLKTNEVKANHGHTQSAHGLSKASGTGQASESSFLYAMVLAIVAQMTTNLKSMGTQAEHIQMLDKNNVLFTQQLEDEQEQAGNITNYTDENSLIASSSISAQMNIIGNNITTNQQYEMQDTSIAESYQTNSSSESSIGQSLLDMDKRLFRQVHFRKG